MYSFRSIPGVHLLGNVGRITNMTGFIDPILCEHLSKQLEKSAEELASVMKKGIVRREFGLMANSKMTEGKKGSNIPLVDSSQLVQGICTQKLSAGEAKLLKGRTNRFEAYFVGVQRNSPIRGAGASHIGEYRPISLFNVARRMVKAHTVVIPGSTIKKSVPKRDFVTPAYAKHKAKHQDYMQGGVTFALRSLRGSF